MSCDLFAACPGPVRALAGLVDRLAARDRPGGRGGRDKRPPPSSRRRRL